MDSSMANVFNASSDCVEDDGGLKPTASSLINEVMNEYFYEKSGVCEKSSSTCDSFNRSSSEDKIDARLRYWKNSLEERQRISCRIQAKTCKEECDILYNKPVTIDHRNTQMVKQVLDYADRLNPSNLLSRKLLQIEDNPCIPGECAQPIMETLPRSERLQRLFSKLEIVGIPSMIKEELAVKNCCDENKSAWIKSESLDRRIVKSARDIGHVFEFYPSFDKLQVIGCHPKNWPSSNQYSAIELITDDLFNDTLTSSSILNSDNQLTICRPQCEQSKPDYALKLNDLIYDFSTHQQISQNIIMDIHFECEPNQRVRKIILQLENIGSKVLDFEWNREPTKGSHCVRKYLPRDLVFIFNTLPFRIPSGECKEVEVLFMPRKPHMRVERWRLVIDPDFFASKECGIVIVLHAKCTPTQKYLEIINNVENMIESTANLSFIETAINEVAEATPVAAQDKPPIPCPYVRVLDDREIFEAENVGFKCCRYQDLELLKAIYKRIRNNSTPWRWNMNLYCLKELILQIDQIDDRKQTFNEFMDIVKNMQVAPKCSLIDEDEEFRYNTKLQTVRSVLTIAIDKWETCVEQLTDILLNKPENLDLTYNTVYIKNVFKIPPEMSVVQHDPPSEASFLHIRSKVVQKKRTKNFQETLYVTTYSQICDIVEDIVSVIVGANSV